MISEYNIVNGLHSLNCVYLQRGNQWKYENGEESGFIHLVEVFEITKNQQNQIESKETNEECKVILRVETIGCSFWQSRR